MWELIWIKFRDLLVEGELWTEQEWREGGGAFGFLVKWEVERDGFDFHGKERERERERESEWVSEWEG